MSRIQSTIQEENHARSRLAYQLGLLSKAAEQARDLVDVGAKPAMRKLLALFDAVSEAETLLNAATLARVNAENAQGGRWVKHEWLPYAPETAGRHV
jgi:hypothetical protein